MAPFPAHEARDATVSSAWNHGLAPRSSPPTRGSLSVEGGFLEAWAQGYHVGSLVILILIVICNYRSGTRLHKLILLELVLALWHGTFIFVADPAYGWYLSATATLLFISYFVHNVVAWLKIRPFLPLWGSRLFIVSLLAVQPFWAAEAWSNFAYFNSLGSSANVDMRPWEALARDPWWIFTTCKLVHAIKRTYGLRIGALATVNSRFGVMLLCMALSLVFLVVDAAVSAARASSSSGINPYWRFALVFKCASDTIFLDDFKSVLDSIVARRHGEMSSAVHSHIEDVAAATAAAAVGPHALPLQPTAFQSRYRDSFPRRKKNKDKNKKEKEGVDVDVPTIRLQHGANHLTLEPRQSSQSSQYSAASETPMLPRPAHYTAYSHSNSIAASTETVLFAQRL
jgi:hypothetical protein